MSLVSTFVRCADGRWYQNPCYRSVPMPGGKAGRDWFLCFDDEDPPELVVRRSPNSPTVAGILTSLGLPYAHVKRCGASMRYFNGRMREATSYHVDCPPLIPWPAPRPDVDGHDGVADERPRGQGVYYGVKL